MPWNSSLTASSRKYFDITPSLLYLNDVRVHSYVRPTEGHRKYRNHSHYCPTPPLTYFLFQCNAHFKRILTWPRPPSCFRRRLMLFVIDISSSAWSQRPRQHAFSHCNFFPVRRNQTGDVKTSGFESCHLCCVITEQMIVVNAQWHFSVLLPMAVGQWTCERCAAS